MRVLHFSTEDGPGGAAKAAHRLHTALREAELDSRMIVLRKKSDDESVLQVPPRQIPVWQSRWQRLRQHMPLLREAELKASYTFNFDQAPNIDSDWLFRNLPDQADVVCLHWITGLLDVATIRRLADHYRCPLVWVLADMEALTGGCHYTFGCDGYQRQCGCCPQLNSMDPHDHSERLWRRKQELLSALPICFVAQSSWVEQRVRQSSLFAGHRIELIPLAIDARTFRPFEKSVARNLLQLPNNKKIVFFGAHYLTDPRKGMPLLIEALHHLKARIEGESSLKPDEVFLLVAGLNAHQVLNDLPFASKFAGHLNSDLLMALAYQAADIFVCPSVEDAGPMMVAEAMLSGTPTVAFDTGAASDLIQPMQSGYLAKLGDSEDLARGMINLLTSELLPEIACAARQAGLNHHSPEVIAKQHLHLYRDLMN